MGSLVAPLPPLEGKMHCCPSRLLYHSLGPVGVALGVPLGVVLFYSGSALPYSTICDSSCTLVLLLFLFFHVHYFKVFRPSVLLAMKHP